MPLQGFVSFNDGSLTKAISKTDQGSVSQNQLCSQVPLLSTEFRGNCEHSWLAMLLVKRTPKQRNCSVRTFSQVCVSISIHSRAEGKVACFHLYMASHCFYIINTKRHCLSQQFNQKWQTEKKKKKRNILLSDLSSSGRCKGALWKTFTSKGFFALGQSEWKQV